MTAAASQTDALPLRLLVMIAQPPDAPGFDGSRAWQDLSAALKPLEAQRLIAVERVSPATEQALRQRLAAGGWHVLHFIGHAVWRTAARYGTLVFENSTGRSRSVTTSYLGDVLAHYDSMALAVIQPVEKGGAFDASPAVLWDRGPAALVSEGTVAGRAQAVFTARLYAALATGDTLQDAAAHARRALDDCAPGASLVLKSRSPHATLVPSPTVAAATVATAAALPEILPAQDAAALAAAAEHEQRMAAARRAIQAKRACAEFDVFLCHNGADKPSVRRIADDLETHGVLPWLDERELPPGQPWQQLLEKQIAGIRAAAVFVGAAGVGPWQEQELYGFLREFVSRRSPVIPVLLPDAPDTPELPIFLKAMTWVDFRVADPDPLSRLIWGITGRRPE